MFSRFSRGVGPLAVAVMFGGCAPAASMQTGGAAGPGDSDIVAIAMAANQGEVQTSQPAVTAATDGAVRQFAQRMISDHSAANERLQALAIPPSENETSRQLAQTAQESTSILQQYNGTPIDHTYMDTQIELHQYTLNSLDDYLIPSATNAQLRAELQAMRATVAAHLEQARQIRGGL